MTRGALDTTPQRCRYTVIAQGPHSTKEKPYHFAPKLPEVACIIAQHNADFTQGTITVATNVPVVEQQFISEHQSRFHGLSVDPEDVLVTTGATEAIAAAVLALCEPGDEVVAFQPYYDSYAATVALAGAVLRPVALRPPGVM